MKCKLCLQEKKLCKRSHIIPNFTYKRELFNDSKNNGRAVSFDMKSGKKRNINTGEYESNILCEECDNKIIGNLEDYFSRVIYGGKIKDNIRNRIIRQQDGLEYSLIAGVDYKKVKLFLLSIIWRASVSSRPFFKHVSLGPYENEIRKAIFENKNVSAGFCPCSIFSFKKNFLLEKSFFDPIKSRKGFNTVYQFFIGGVQYNFLITKKSSDSLILELALKEIGELKIVNFSEEMGNNLLKRYFQKQKPFYENRRFLKFLK